MSLSDHYELEHKLTASKQYSSTEVLGMIPFERDIKATLISYDIEREEMERERARSRQ